MKILKCKQNRFIILKFFKKLIEIAVKNLLEVDFEQFFRVFDFTVIEFLNSIIFNSFWEEIFSENCEKKVFEEYFL